MLAKKVLYEALDSLPEEVTPDQLIAAVDRVLFVEDARAGLQDVKEGRVYTEDETRQML